MPMSFSLLLRRLVAVSVVSGSLVACSEGAAPGSSSSEVVSQASTITGGHCDDPFDAPAARGFDRPFSSGLTTLSGPPQHRIRDVILNPGTGGTVRVHATYGTFNNDLKRETVELFARVCPGWVSWGRATTDRDGVANFSIPADVPAGDYRIRAVVLGDATTADGVVGVWPEGTEIVVTDIDGTITTDDGQAFSDYLAGTTDADAFPDVVPAFQTWRGKDYRVVYLTARPQFLNRYTRAYLDERGLPEGPTQLTTEPADFLSDAGKRAFKGGFLIGLQEDLGLSIRAAYGNSTSDFEGYADAEIPLEDTYSIGSQSGEGGTQPLGESYTAHLPAIASYPDAVQP